MSKKKLHTLVLLDRTGSMGGTEAQTVDAVNEYLNGLAAGDVRVKASLIQFDHFGQKNAFETNFWRERLTDKGPRLDREHYRPRGGTPLYDAIGHAVTQLRGAATDKNKSENVSLVVMTDGMENSSTEYTLDSVKGVLKRCEDDGWLVTFLGAGLGVAGQGIEMGARHGTTVDYDKTAAVGTMSAAAASTLRYTKAGGGVAGQSLAEWTDEERRLAKS